MPLCGQYPLGDEEHWPVDGSLNYNTILQLELLCKRQGKWTEIPYVHIFFHLRDMKELSLKYGIVVCPKSEPTRQMVLGTGNPPIKAHIPCPTKRLEPPTAPELPGILPCIQTCPHIWEDPLHKSQLMYVP